MNFQDYLKTTTQEEFARLMGVSQGMVSYWLRNPQRITAERCRQMEEKTNDQLRRIDLRPDIFGPIDDLSGKGKECSCLKAV